MEKALKLLIVGDARDDAETFVRELRAAGFDPAWRQVDTEARLRAALRGRWDAVLAVEGSAELTSEQTLAVVRERDPDVPFVLISDDLDEGRGVAAMRRGANDCLRRSELVSLAQAVERELEGAESRRQAQAAARSLAAEQRRYRALFDAAPVALMEVDLADARRFFSTFADREGTSEAVLSAPGAGPLQAGDDELMKAAVQRVRVIAINAAAQALLGAERAEQLLDPRALRSTRRSVWLDVLAALDEDLESAQKEMTLLTLEGRPVEVLLSFSRPSSPGEGRSVVISLTDLGDARSLRRQLEFAERMEALCRLSRKVAHDFNNLLTVIRGYCGLLLETVADSDPARRDLGMIEDAARSAEQLTMRLMACNRPAKWEPRSMNLNAEIDQLRASLQRCTGDGVDVVTSLADGVWDVEFDPVYFQEMLLHLTQNARAAMPAGGKLTLTTSNTRLEAPEGPDPAAAAGGDYAMLTLRDTGHGMSAETLHRCFEPFFTTGDPRQSRGLGLPTVYGIIRQGRGLIWSHSQPGVGSTFEILLPRK